MLHLGQKNALLNALLYVNHRWIFRGALGHSRGRGFIDRHHVSKLVRGSSREVEHDSSYKSEIVKRHALTLRIVDRKVIQLPDADGDSGMNLDIQTTADCRSKGIFRSLARLATGGRLGRTVAHAEQTMTKWLQAVAPFCELRTK